MSSGEFRPRYLLLEQRGEITVATLRISLLSEDINLEQFGHELFALVEQAWASRLQRSPRMLCRARSTSRRASAGV